MTQTSQISFLFLEKIINSTPDPLFVKDSDHRWVVINEAFCDLLGYTKEELINKSDYDFFSDDEAKAFWDDDDYVFETGKTFQKEEKVTDKDGITFTVSTKKSIFLDEEGNKYLVGIIRDVTQLRDLETKQKENMIQLESSLKNRDQELISFTIKLTEKEQLIQKLKEELNNLKNNPGEDMLNRLNKLINHIDIHSKSENVWIQFNNFFQQLHSNFLDNLKNKYPDLSVNELRLCALIKMQFKNNEISNILNIQIKSVEMAMYRLKKKFELDKTEKLRTFLNQSFDTE